MALLVPLICGRFDVSVAANLGFCAVAAAAAMGTYHQSLFVAILVALLVGTTVGVVNGIVVAFLGVNSIISTIGTATILTGLVDAYTGGQPIFNGLSRTLTNLPTQHILDVPAIFIVTLVVCVICWYAVTQMPFGRYLLAVGSNLNAAHLNGVRIRRTVLLSFIVSGLIAGAAGVLQVSAEGSGDPSIGNLNLLIPALAAVFLGATTIRPGRYNVGGTLIAIIFIATVESGLTLNGLQPWVNDVFNGAAVMIAIALSAQIRRRRTGSVDVGD
jgi:ribose transport system permease protein